MSANLMSLARSGGKFLKLYGDRKMVRPLPYLRRVAYLESHGNEWIGTGIYMSKKEKGSISIKYKTNSINTENDPIGNYSSNGHWPHFCFTCDKGYNNLYSSA